MIKLNTSIKFWKEKFQDVVKFEYDKTEIVGYETIQAFQDVVKFENDKTLY